MVEIVAMPLHEVLVLRATRALDERGFLSEMYNQRSFRAAGIDINFVQDNQTVSRRKGVVRGLHFQVPPRAQAKLVWAVKGAILDVVVDLRLESPTYRQHALLELSEDNQLQVLIPPGCAHGSCTLSHEVVTYYKFSDFYSPEHQAGIHWLDPDLGITWPVSPEDAIISDKDRRLPRMAELAQVGV